MLTTWDTLNSIREFKCCCRVWLKIHLYIGAELFWGNMEIYFHFLLFLALGVVILPDEKLVLCSLTCCFILLSDVFFKGRVLIALSNREHHIVVSCAMKFILSEHHYVRSGLLSKFQCKNPCLWNFQTWLLIGWQHSCQPIWNHDRKPG